MSSLSDVSLQIQGNTLSFPVQWRPTRNGHYSLYRNEGAIFVDCSSYSPIYFASSYDTTENSKYYMASMKVEDEAVWKNLLILEDKMKESIRSTKEAKKKTIKGFLYTNTDTGVHYINFRMYHSIVWKRPGVMKIGENNTKEWVPFEQLQTTLSTRGMQAKIAIKPDAVWSFGSAVGMAVFVSNIILQQVEVEEVENNEEALFHLMSEE